MIFCRSSIRPIVHHEETHLFHVQFLDKEQDNKDDDLDFRALENGFVSWLTFILNDLFCFTFLSSTSPFFFVPNDKDMIE